MPGLSVHRRFMPCTFQAINACRTLKRVLRAQIWRAVTPSPHTPQRRFAGCSDPRDPDAESPPHSPVSACS
ncbi:protein of unknown function [Streptomyces murinus]